MKICYLPFGQLQIALFLLIKGKTTWCRFFPCVYFKYSIILLVHVGITALYLKKEQGQMHELSSRVHCWDRKVYFNQPGIYDVRFSYKLQHWHIVIISSYFLLRKPNTQVRKLQSKSFHCSVVTKDKKFRMISYPSIQIYNNDIIILHLFQYSILYIILMTMVLFIISSYIIFQLL